MGWLLSIALCSVALVANVDAAPPDPPRAGGHRIRPQGSRATQLLRDGVARSATFRTLVGRIEASDVFVYVEVSPFIQPGLSGKLAWMAKSGPYRYLRATISADHPPDQGIATLAHELQHAVEVVDHETVVDEQSLASLYRRIGRRSGAAVDSGWETIAAQDTGYQVRKELLDATRAAVAARVSDIDHL